MDGALGHPAPATARTEAPHLAGKRHQVLTRATFALKARHAGLEHATQEELPKLALDELGQAVTAARFRHRAQESLQMLADHLMQHRVLGVSRSIHGRHTRHAQG